MLFILAFIPAMIANKKGCSFGLWYLYGLLIFIIALPHALIMDAKGVKKCPYCKELVKSDAIKCKYCSSDIKSSSEFPNDNDAKVTYRFIEPSPEMKLKLAKEKKIGWVIVVSIGLIIFVYLNRTTLMH